MTRTYSLTLGLLLFISGLLANLPTASANHCNEVIDQQVRPAMATFDGVRNEIAAEKANSSFLDFATIAVTPKWYDSQKKYVELRRAHTGALNAVRYARMHGCASGEVTRLELEGDQERLDAALADWDRVNESFVGTAGNTFVLGFSGTAAAVRDWWTGQGLSEAEQRAEYQRVIQEYNAARSDPKKMQVSLPEFLAAQVGLGMDATEENLAKLRLAWDAYWAARDVLDAAGLEAPADANGQTQANPPTAWSLPNAKQAFIDHCVTLGQTRSECEALYAWMFGGPAPTLAQAPSTPQSPPTNQVTASQQAGAGQTNCLDTDRLIPLPRFADPQCQTIDTLLALIKELTNRAIQFVFAIALIFLVIAGYQFATSQGNKDAVGGAKQSLLYITIGVVVVLGAYLAINTIASYLIQKP